MKVLHLIDTLEIGGAEQSLLAILQRFRVVQPVMCHIYPGDTLRPAYEAAGILTISLDIPGKYAFPQAITRVRHVIETEQPDLIHTTLFRADVVGRMAGWSAHRPVVSSFVNDSYSSVRRGSLSPAGRVKLRGVQEIDRITARLVCHFVAVSQATKASNCRALSIPEHKVSVIYRGRDAAPFLNVADGQVCALRAELGLDQATPVLINVARLLQRKGQVDLIRAMPAVLARFPHTRLLIAGDGPDRTLLEATIRDVEFK